MTTQGTITGVNGNMITVRFEGAVALNEVGYAKIEGVTLMCEIVRIRGRLADMQVFEDTSDLAVGNLVEYTGELLSVELGPGLLTQIYDGLQNPLPKLAEACGFFLQRGKYIEALPRDTKWAFTPTAKPGDVLQAGDALGTVPEGIFKHRIMLPFGLKGRQTVKSVAPAGSYTVADVVGVVTDDAGVETRVSMVQRWPVKVPITCYEERLRPEKTMVTQSRTIDTFFPVALGGTYCVPGPFGAGKTVLQQTISRFAQVDIVIYAACGERAGEVVDMLREFPHMQDPRTGRTLMDRTTIICNTSSMPVAAREASVYTAATIAAYYRQMGLDVLLLADSTSRWAQALREMSGRLEEIPGEEARRRSPPTWRPSSPRSTNAPAACACATAAPARSRSAAPSRRPAAISTSPSRRPRSRSWAPSTASPARAPTRAATPPSTRSTRGASTRASATPRPSPRSAPSSAAATRSPR